MAAKVLRSTHGRQLLALLSEIEVTYDGRVMTNMVGVEQQVADIMMKDTLASRLGDPEAGNNAFHTILMKNLPVDVTLRLLNTLSASGPEGLKKANKAGDLPLHVYLLRRIVSLDVVNALLSRFPGAASVQNGLGLVPLFLCVMREDISADIVKALCKADPSSPGALNTTQSHPLHFAAKKTYPNLEILRILLRRYPAAAMKVNSHGLLPLHCAASVADDLPSVKLIHEAYPEALLLTDRQGRTPLHLAVLAVGTDHSNAQQAEVDDQLRDLRLQMQQMRMDNSGVKQKSEGKKGDEEQYPDEENGDEEEDEEERLKREQKPVWALQEVGRRSRKVVYYLARQAPILLAMKNNFNAVPVDTVLSKTKSERTKKKIVAVYGLYDDAVTARLLLLLHREALRHRWPSGSEYAIPVMIGKHVEELKELNWMARKPALLASYQGQQLLRASRTLSPSTVFTGATSTATAAASKSGKSGSKAQSSGSSHSAVIGGGDAGVLHTHNLLGRLRLSGVADLVRHVLQFV